MSQLLSAVGVSCVVLDGVVKRYGDHAAVAGLDLRVGRGEITALLGPNGAGKSTTLEMCEGFIPADEGRIRIFGLDPVRDREILRPRIGVMLQGGGGYPGARAGEMLTLAADCARSPLDPAWLADLLGLSTVLRTPYRRLSTGQQQRLALACALVGRPELIMLDEPTSNLDPQARSLVWELINHLREDGVAVLLSTHALDEAEALADQVVIMHHGHVVASGTPLELTRRDADHALRFSAPPHLDLEEFRSVLAFDYRVEEPAPGSYVVTGFIDSSVIAAVARTCDRLNAVITELSVEKRRLEDLFLDLTGREVVA